MVRFVFRMTVNQAINYVDTLMHQWIKIDNVSMVILNVSEGATVKSVVRRADLPDHPASSAGHLR